MPPHDEAPWIVEFYRDRRGRKPAEEFLDTLTAAETAEALRLLRLLREYGIQLGMPHARPIGGMWELRPGPNRFFYVAVRGRRFVILHGYRKRSQAAPQRELETAQRRLADLLAREERKP
jgi:phage-related protein